MQRNTFNQLDLSLCILEWPSLETVLNPELSPATATTKCFTVYWIKLFWRHFKVTLTLKLFGKKHP